MKRTAQSITAVAITALLLPLIGCGDDAEEQQAETRVEHLVSAAPYPSLEIHTDWVEDRRFRDGVDDRLVDGLEEVVDKPDGVHVVEGDELPAEAPQEGWSFDELRQLVESRADAADVSDGAIDAYTLFVDGEYADGSGEGTVLGIAWSNRYSVLFQDSIEDACQSRLGAVPGLGDRLCENAELVIWRHEIGHVLGLVNRGAPLTSDHQDPEADAHCVHDDCVMYRAFRRPGALDVLADRMGDDRSTPDFDQACQDDLEAARAE